MLTYEGTLDAADSADFHRQFQAGNIQLDIHFRWNTVVQEQLDLYRRAIEARAAADPLLPSINREYSWVDYMLSLPSEQADILALLESDNPPELPQSIATADISNELKASQLYESRLEAEEIQDMIQPYFDNECWNIEITADEGESVTGQLRTGGWFHEQNDEWRVRFVSEKSDIGYDDLELVGIEMEVKE